MISRRQVRAPRIARQVDWVNVWPSQRSRTRPRVQKYCLMSVANAYTDFHIDFGGMVRFMLLILWRLWVGRLLTLNIDLSDI